MPVITLNIGPEIAKNNPVIPKFNTSSNVVMRCLLSKTSCNFSSNNYLSYSISYFTSSSASYNYSYTASRCIGSVSYSRAYTGVYCTYIVNIFIYKKSFSPSTHTLTLNRNLYY